MAHTLYRLCLEEVCSWFDRGIHVRSLELPFTVKEDLRTLHRNYCGRFYFEYYYVPDGWEKQITNTRETAHYCASCFSVSALLAGGVCDRTQRLDACSPGVIHDYSSVYENPKCAGYQGFWSLETDDSRTEYFCPDTSDSWTGYFPVTSRLGNGGTFYCVNCCYSSESTGRSKGFHHWGWMNPVQHCNIAKRRCAICAGPLGEWAKRKCFCRV